MNEVEKLRYFKWENWRIYHYRAHKNVN